MQKLALVSLLIILSACQTPTIKIKLIEVPKQYLKGCPYKPFKASKDAIISGYSGDLKLFLIEQAQHELELKSIIEGCDKDIQDIIRYQERMISDS